MRASVVWIIFGLFGLGLFEICHCLTGIVYVYTVDAEVCNSASQEVDSRTSAWDRFPSYITDVLKQAVFTQQGQVDTKVMFISNLAECNAIKTEIIMPVLAYVKTLGTFQSVESQIEFIDSASIKSDRTTLVRRKVGGALLVDKG